MESFDAMTMPYLGNPLPIATMQNLDYLNTVPTLDTQERRSDYDDTLAGYSAISNPLYPPVLSHHTPSAESPALTDHSLMDSGDDICFPQPLIPCQPIRSFSGNQFEDTSVEIMPPLETLPSEQVQSDSSIDQNHKLLDFSIPTFSFTLLDYSLRQTSLSLAAQLHGMFFLAENLWTTSPTSESAVPPPQAELTCYRRNLFQITGSVTLPRTLRYIMTDQGDRIPILAQELTVSATESVEGNPVKLISVPWKTPAANTTATPEDKTEKEPPAIPLDTMTGQDMDTDYATFSIAWKRLQFRVATANNGRRKELQQRFVVRLKVVATLSTGAKVSICEAHSGPVIVRGRSPRNFQSRKDLPLSGSVAASRKNTQCGPLPSLKRTAIETAGSQQAAPAKRSKSPQESVQHQQQPQPLQLQHPPSSPYPEWMQFPATNSATLPPPNFTTSKISATMPVYAQSNPEMSRSSQRRRRNSASAGEPISRFLEEEGEQAESGPDGNNGFNAGYITAALQLHSTTANHRRINSDVVSVTKMQKTPPIITQCGPMGENHTDTGTATLLAQHSLPLAPPLPSPYILDQSESADLVYEYFPLGLDDWQAPVQAVYRPHAVNHMSMPEDPKAIIARNMSKRYFTGEGS
jgi:hypothetical protein